MKKKSLVGWVDKEFISISQDFNCYGEHYTNGIYDKRDNVLKCSPCIEKPIKARKSNDLRPITHGQISQG